MRECESDAARLVLSVIAIAIILLVLVCLFPNNAHAAERSGTLTNSPVDWTLDDDGTLTFTATLEGDCAIPDLSSEQVEDSTGFPADIREEVKRIVIGNGVTTIDDYAFSTLSATAFPNVVEVDMSSSSVKAIGANAFREMYKLTSVTFSSCLETIEGGAFRNDSSLSGTLYLPATLKSINGTATFQGASYSVVQIPSTCTYTKGNPILKNGTFPSGIVFDYIDPVVTPTKEWGDTIASFEPDSGVLTVTGKEGGSGVTGDLEALKDSLSSQGYGIQDVKSVVFGDGVVGIAQNALGSDSSGDEVPSNINTISIGASVESIGMAAFGSLAGLQEVTIAEGSNLVTLRGNAFYQCTSLKSLDLSESKIERLEATTFESSALEKLELPATLKVLVSNSLARLSGLTSITLPSSLEEIQAGCFSSDAGDITINVDMDFAAAFAKGNFFDTTSIVAGGAANGLFKVHGKTYDDQTNAAIEALCERFSNIESEYEFHDCSDESFAIAPDTDAIDFVCSTCGESVHFDVSVDDSSAGPVDESNLVTLPKVTISYNDGTEDHPVTDLGKPIELTLPLGDVQDGTTVKVVGTAADGTKMDCGDAVVENGAVTFQVETLGTGEFTATVPETEDPGTDPDPGEEDPGTDPGENDPGTNPEDDPNGTTPEDPSTNPSDTPGTGSNDGNGGDAASTQASQESVALAKLAKTGDEASAALALLAFASLVSATTLVVAARKRKRSLLR